MPVAVSLLNFFPEDAMSKDRFSPAWACMLKIAQSSYLLPFWFICYFTRV